ncbi:MAG: MerR family DNA-binding protein [Gammaproteobacteria bacterium]|nr:MerR family DNA-binding protein [Gammaproteobacteria bacterium]
MPLSKLTIGKVATLSDVSVETIRYYQKIGLIKEPNKPLKGYRHYSMENIRQLKFIKKAQRLGFTLNEVAELLEIGSGKCSDIKIKAQNKHNQISQQIKELQALKKTLNNLIDSCSNTSESKPCPIVETLSELS